MDLVGFGSMLFTASGAGLLIGAGRTFQRTRRLIARSITAVGVVVDLAVVPDGIEESYHPVVQFTTASGARITFESVAGSYPPAYRTGEQVLVVYDPAQPHAAAIRSFVSLWLLPIVLASLGGIFAFIGLGLFFRLIPV